ncbi:hypothetical protein [Bradyrhizobium japonicum]
MNETMLADIPGRGVDALKQLRAMTADICDVVPLKRRTTSMSPP